MSTEDPSPEALQAEIEHTRENMRETIDALQDRLSPTRAAHQVSGWIQEEMGPMIRTVGEAIRKHSIPAAITAGGLIWLTVALLREDDEGEDRAPVGTNRRLAAPDDAVDVGPGVKRRAGNDRSSANRRANAGRLEAAAASVRDSADELHRSTKALEAQASGVWDTVKHKVSSAFEQAQEYISTGTDQAKTYLEGAYETSADAVRHAYETSANAVGRAYETSADAVGRAYDYAGEKTRQAGQAVGRSYQESPFLYGLLAVAAGAAAALALPSTERENRMVGPYRDDLFDATEARIDALRTKAEEATIAGLHAAADTLREATASLISHIESAQASVSETISEVAEDAQDKASEVADKAKPRTTSDTRGAATPRV